MKEAAIRDAYGEALRELGSKNPNVVVLEADVGNSTKSCLFGTAYPQRYFNVGISELDMMAEAAGWASCGMIPFVNTFSTFVIGRAIDPVQAMIGYDRLNVKIAGAYSGLSDSYDGASHQSINDLALLRTIPNLTIFSPSDAWETQRLVEESVRINGPVYLRLSRAAFPQIHTPETQILPGKAVVLQDGEDVALMATGAMVHEALAAAERLEQQGISTAVIEFHTIKPLDEECILKYARRTKAIITVEEHNIVGGLGSAISEITAEKHPATVIRIGLCDYAESGDYRELLRKYGIDQDKIFRTVTEMKPFFSL